MTPQTQVKAGSLVDSLKKSFEGEKLPIPLGLFLLALEQIKSGKIESINPAIILALDPIKDGLEERHKKVVARSLRAQPDYFSATLEAVMDNPQLLSMDKATDLHNAANQKIAAKTQEGSEQQKFAAEAAKLERRKSSLQEALDFCLENEIITLGHSKGRSIV